MKSRLLRMAVTWIAPIVIGFIVKKIEEKIASKNQTKTISEA